MGSEMCIRDSLRIVDFGLISIFVEVFGFGTDRLGEGHQSRHSEIPIVVLAWITISGPFDPEIAKVRQRSAVVEIHFTDDLCQPLTVGRKATMILDDHIDIVASRKFAQLAKPVCSPFDLLLVASTRRCIDAD